MFYCHSSSSSSAGVPKSEDSQCFWVSSEAKEPHLASGEPPALVGSERDPAMLESAAEAFRKYEFHSELKAAVGGPVQSACHTMLV